MGAGKRQAALLLAGVGLLLLGLQAVDAACCTTGQPTYVNADISSPIFTFGTCSDGPCVGPGYDYLAAGASQSANPQSCCDAGPGVPDPNGGFYYNPPLGARTANGSLALWAYQFTSLFGEQYPGTGRPCNAGLAKWQCSIAGVVVPTCQDTDLVQTGSQPYPCPEGWVFDNTSQSVNLTKEECCLPLPSLAIISRFPPGYTGPTANLTADQTAGKDLCTKFPSPRQDVNGVTILQPGPGKCGQNQTGYVQPGTYILDEGQAPTDTVFTRWECYNTTTGVAGSPVVVDNITLAGNTSETCVAVFDLLPLPKLALISQFPAGYNGPPANLTATSGNETCVEAPAAQLGQNGITVEQPGQGLCRSNGTMPPGTYTLDAVAPPGFDFDSYTCYDVNNATSSVERGRDVETVLLELADVVTCLAIFVPRPKLALTSRFPADYSGPTANLTATATSDSCSKAPSPRQGSNNVTVLQPGAGQCGPDGFVDQGVYSLAQVAPANTTFFRWECYDITLGAAQGPTTSSSVTVAGNQSVSCVAVYNYTAPLAPSPSPSPGPSPAPLPKLALISHFPANYTGPSANLSASNGNNGTCVEAPSARLNRNNVTVAAPGAGFCGLDGSVPAGNYTFSETAPPGTVFVKWDCYEIINGNATGPIAHGMTPTLDLSGTKTVTCKAVFDLAPAASNPKLSIISEYPPGYTGPTANLTATGKTNNGTCVKAPSTRLNETAGITILTPGPGFCGVNGSVVPDIYDLTQVAPPGVVFDRFECYAVINGAAVLISNTTTSVDLTGNTTASCKAVYKLPASPSPSPSPGPKLALISDFPAEYNASNPTANLTAINSNNPPSICDESPSARLGVNNVTVAMPGAGFCNPVNDGVMPPGTYTLSQVPPQNTKFDRFDCYNVTGGMAPVAVNISNGVVLQDSDSLTCVAKYVLVNATCGDVTPGTPGAQLFNCSRASMARNESATALGPPSDSVCCMATCADANMTAATAQPFSCPANFTLSTNASALSPPSNSLCCLSLIPFNITKTGPGLVKPDQAFNFSVVVTVMAPTTGLIISDDLPAGLLPGSTAATWTATSSVAGTPTSGTCVTNAAASPEVVCTLGVTASWAAGDIIRVTVPVIAGSTGQNVTNVATATDSTNRTDSDDARLEICAGCVDGESFDAFKTGPTTVQAGQVFEYSVAVHFFSKPAGPVNVTDTLPAGLQPTTTPATWRATFANASSMANQLCITSGNTFACNLGPNWSKGDAAEITLPVIATAGASGNVVNRAVVSDGNLTKNPEAPVTIQPAPTGPPFTLSKTGPTSARVGEAFDYNVVVSFLGSATGVVVIDDLPLQLTATSTAASWQSITVDGSNPSGVCQTTGQRITCTLGAAFSWSRGDRVEIRVPVVANANATGTVNNTAVVRDSQNRTTDDNHLTDVVPLPGSPFTITKTGPMQPVQAGQVFSYSIVVTFLGPTRGVKVQDVLPPQVTSAGAASWMSKRSNTSTACVNAGASPVTVNCDLGASTTWNAGETVEVTVPVTAGLTAATNAVNTAIISDETGRTSNDTFPVTITVDTAAPFTIVKTGPTRVKQNELFNFNVIVVMLSTAKGLRLVDNLPPGLYPTSTATWTATTGTGNRSGNCVTVNRTATQEPSYNCDLGAAVTWQRGDRIQLLVPAVATTVAVPLVNQATVTDDQGRNANATATVTADIPNIPQDALRITKTGPLTPVSVGQAFDFVITVNFDQAGPFTAARIADNLPDGLLPSNTPATWTGSNGGRSLNGTCVTNVNNKNGEILCDLGATVAWVADDSVVVTVPVIAGSSAGNNLVNRAIVNATLQGQTLTLDDTASVNVTVPLLKVNKVGPGVSVAANTSFPWTITAGVTSGVVNPLIVVDELPSTDIKFVAPVPANCALTSDQKVTCTWAEDVAPGHDKVIQLTAIASKAGSYVNKATALTNMTGVANQTSTATVVIENRPNPSPIPPPREIIGVTKKGPSQAVETNKELTFTLTPSVISGNVPNMTLVDTIDASSGITFLRVSPSAGCTVQPQLLKCNLIAPFVALTLTAKGSKAGTFTNRVEVRSPGGAIGTDQADVTIVAPTQETCSTWVAKNGCSSGNVLNPSQANVVLTTTNPISIRLTCCQAATPQGVPDVRVNKTASKSQVTQGSRFNYTFSVKNLGSLDPAPSTAYNVIVEDTLPVGVAATNSYWIVPTSVSSACSFSGVGLRTVRCLLGTMLEQAVNKVTIEAVADGTNFAPGSTQQATLINTVQLTCANSSTATQQDPKCDKTSKAPVTVIKGPDNTDLTITKTASPASGDSGTVFTFTIVVTPVGGAVDNVVVTDPMPPQLTNAQLLTTFGGKCTMAAQRRAKSATKQPAPTTPKRSGNSAINDVFNALLRNRNNGGAVSNTSDQSTTASQQTIRCNFGTISGPQEIRFTATGSTVGSWTNTATVTFTGTTSPKDAKAVVQVTNPPRAQGACCDGSFMCHNNVDQASCTSKGGTWSSNSRACNTKMFCSGACCSGGNTAAATCKITKKAKCSSGIFGAQSNWDANGDCNNPGFCPKPSQCTDRCQQCDSAHPCCGGLSCLPSGNCPYNPRYICVQTQYYSSYCNQLRSASSATAAAAIAANPPAAIAATSAAVTAAAVKTFATPADVKNTFCSPMGGLCGRSEEGRQCCGPRADCIAVGVDKAKCMPRDTCKGGGKACSDTSECCSGHICQDNKCTLAQCKTPNNCSARDYLCKYWHELNCEAYYAAPMSSVDR